MWSEPVNDVSLCEVYNPESAEFLKWDRLSLFFITSKWANEPAYSKEPCNKHRSECWIDSILLYLVPTVLGF